jgi:hypothetical protein
MATTRRSLAKQIRVTATEAAIDQLLTPRERGNFDFCSWRFLTALVPGEGLEPPTFGLQNRCTTAVLTRPGVSYRKAARSVEGFPADVEVSRWMKRV